MNDDTETRKMNTNKYIDSAETYQNQNDQNTGLFGGFGSFGF